VEVRESACVRERERERAREIVEVLVCEREGVCVREKRGRIVDVRERAQDR